MLLPWPPRRRLHGVLSAVIAASLAVPLLAACDTRPIVPGFGLGGGGSSTSETGPVTGSASGTGGVKAGTGGAAGTGGDAGADDG